MKRVLIVLCVVAMVFSSLCITAAAETQPAEESVKAAESPFDAGYPEIKPADAHFKAYQEDGTMNKKPELKIGDVNIDGRIDASDALYVLNYSLPSAPYGKDGIQYPNNLYERFKKQQPQLKWYLEAMYTSYYYSWRWEWEYHNERLLAPVHECYYRFNSVLVADTDFDGKVNAADALLILKFAVGKIDSFPRKDFSAKGDLFYIPWEDEWRPHMLANLGWNWATPKFFF